MENKAIAAKFKLLGQLTELMNGNPYRIKSLYGAAFKLDKLPFRIADKPLDELAAIPGIGSGTSQKIKELLDKGTMAELEQLLESVPEGVLELLTIKGLGPKKLAVIWNDLGIESLGELLYACNENRLAEAKGFGPKTQAELIRSIEFKLASQGFYLFAQAERIVEPLLAQLRSLFGQSKRFQATGAYRRCLDTLNLVELLLDKEDIPQVSAYFEKETQWTVYERDEETLEVVHETGLPLKFYGVTEDSFLPTLFFTTGHAEHLTKLNIYGLQDIPSAENEEAIYHAFGYSYIAPELREGGNEIELARQQRLPRLIQYEDLKGSLHNHSTWSDGVHSIEEMALHCRDVLGLEYLGICDHSRSAVYAKGLDLNRLAQQWKEIETLNEKLVPFKVFKGIESDILGDGSLDYPDEWLKEFDFIVASVHANLKMDEVQATKRLIKAIEHPCTTILGHPTGRLLLSRKGYPIDYKKVIDACAANGVVIEINSNPLRLDLDWRWHQYALEKGAWLSVNPDAHRKEGLSDMHYGVLAARKGGLSADRCLNALNRDDLDAFFSQKRNLLTQRF